jgi:hypothetical protein
MINQHNQHISSCFELGQEVTRRGSESDWLFTAGLRPSSCSSDTITIDSTASGMTIQHAPSVTPVDGGYSGARRSCLYIEMACLPTAQTVNSRQSTFYSDPSLRESCESIRIESYAFGPCPPGMSYSVSHFLT